MMVQLLSKLYSCSLVYYRNFTTVATSEMEAQMVTKSLTITRVTQQQQTGIE